MSGTAAHAVVAPARSTAPGRIGAEPAAARPAGPRLRVVPPARRRAPRTPFVLLVGGLLATGLVGLLLINTVIDQDAFRLHALQSGQSALDVQEAALRQTADDDAAPAALASRAAALGMVPAGPPAFVREAKLPKGGVRYGNLLVVPGAAPTAPAAATPPAATPPAATQPAATQPAATPSASSAPTPAASPSPATATAGSAGNPTATSTTSTGADSTSATRATRKRTTQATQKTQEAQKTQATQRTRGTRTHATARP